MKKMAMICIIFIFSFIFLIAKDNAFALYSGGYVNNMGYGYAGNWNMSRYYPTLYTITNPSILWSPKYSNISQYFYKPHPNSFQVYKWVMNNRFTPYSRR
jgi:hypothetical protein